MKFYRILPVALLVLLLTGCDQMVFNTLEVYAKITNSLKHPDPGRRVAVSASLSSDGRYVVSAHRGNKLYLWDIEQRRKTRIAKNVNLYSAYFIRGSDTFIWQDLDNTVHVQSVAAGELFTFDYPEPTYGHLMTHDLQRYIAADVSWGIHVVDLGAGVTHTLKEPSGRSDSAYLRSGKVLNMSLSADETLLGTAGSGGPYDDRWSLDEEAERDNYAWMNGVNLWSLETLKPIAKLPGNSAKTHASISPDGQWVVSGDENGIGRFWNTDNPEKHFINSSYYHGLYRGQNEEGNTRPRDLSGFIPPPPKISSRTAATGFISGSRYYFHITTSGWDRDPYAVLFEVGNPWPIKYFELGSKPALSSTAYSLNLTISTAPEAGILVVGQYRRGGINVYQFDSEALTLERIWVGH